MIIIFAILIFYFGLLFGLFIAILERKKAFIGTIIVIKKEDGILYSLEMDDSPEKLQFKKRAYFKVKISDDESNRR